LAAYTTCFNFTFKFNTMQLPSTHAIAANLLAIASLACTQSFAHPIDPVPKADAKLQSEIALFRKEFQAAATQRDAAALRRYYTEDFTHTHTSGKQDGKDARIVSVIAGEATVEMAATPEFYLSCYGESMCIARALSPIKRATDGKWFDVRWTQTFVKTSKGWQIAISQATGLPNTVREAP
jgi:ketosteroid isomerase-like protein